ncbi:MAG: hypothetical protein V7L12_27630 [Nostoc sp.]
MLDTHPLSQVTHPQVNPKVQQWLKSLQKTETVIRVPEIADYELRRELLRQGKQKSIDRLNKLSQSNLSHTTDSRNDAKSSRTMGMGTKPGEAYGKQ